MPFERDADHIAGAGHDQERRWRKAILVTTQTSIVCSTLGIKTTVSVSSIRSVISAGDRTAAASSSGSIQAQ
jgi:hypothetical protein